MNTNMRQYFFIQTMAFLFISLLVPIIQSTAEETLPQIELRSSDMNLSVSQVQSMPNIAIRSKKSWGFYGHSTIQHAYEVRTIGDNKVVIDHTTGLMWHQSGSYDYMKRKEIKKWIRSLNRSGYAGHHDWRVPTVEEASSLLESSEKNGNLFIDDVFDKKQRWIWTSDSCSSGGMWRVYFDDGYVDWGDVGLLFVRPVRKTR
ncbi:arylsulfatase A and related enzymes [Candidatus Scalindua japonica]|uniref:Arylsulfatase A and related enzymes n=1 Tax=Candidatus Scalindua japonica TaxID=1284222 RepID=A0A286TXS6_9BACT|nr:DUF1566 domain-containing protein [Candidatus Scalindua japonica]GAX60688.1 arylsulfatase A and related enzymes [Candidatus Scalindua japonica]